MLENEVKRNEKKNFDSDDDGDGERQAALETEGRVIIKKKCKYIYNRLFQNIWSAIFAIHLLFIYLYKL